MKDSLRLKESISMNGKEIQLNNTVSGRLVGEVTVDEFDKFGRKLFSNITYNDITLPGSIFVLEQIFKTKSSGVRFLHPTTNLPAYDGNSDTISGTTPEQVESIDDEYIFGFMAGRGGEIEQGVITNKYEITKLSDTNNNSSFMPLRIVNKTDNPPTDDGIPYYFRIENGDKAYYYAKAFSTVPRIITKWADGSGIVNEDDINTYTSPILTYGEVILNIDEKDIREYFEDSDECYINQIGLVAGKPVYDDNDQTKIKDFTDIKLVTSLNFRSKDLSNNENKIKFTYKIYCL